MGHKVFSSKGALGAPGWAVTSSVHAEVSKNSSVMHLVQTRAIKAG